MPATWARQHELLVPLLALVLGVGVAVDVTESHQNSGAFLVIVAATAGPIAMAQTLAAGGGPGASTLHVARPSLKGA